MGAEIQARRDSNGYYSIWGLHKDAKNDIWNQENRTKKNGQCPESTLPWNLKLDGSLEYDKEKVKQIILKHESTFRYQLHELHRLYVKQRELMNVFRRTNVQPVRVQEEASSLSHFPSQISFEDPKCGWHGSDVPSTKLVFGQSSQSESSCKQSFPGVSKEKNIMPFASRDHGSSEVWEPPSSKGNLSRREVIDLEIPADPCMSSEATYSREKCCELPVVESNLTPCTKDNVPRKGVETTFSNALNDHREDDISRSSLPLRRKVELADLNEPILLDDSSDSDSADNPTGLGSTWANKKNEDKSATPDSVLNPMWKNKGISSKGNNKCETSFKSVQSINDMDRKEHMTYDLNSTEVFQPVSSSKRTDVYARDSSVAFQSYKGELEKQNEMPNIWTAQRTKRKLFGVDIFEVNDQSLVTETTTGHHCDKFNESGSKRSVIDVKSDVDSSTRSFHGSITEMSCLNDLSIGSHLYTNRPEGNPLANCHLINNKITSDFLSRESASVDLVKLVGSGEHLELKQAKVPRIATEISNGFRDGFAAGYNILPADCRRKQIVLEEFSLHPRKAIHCAEQLRASKSYYQLNLDSLQNSSLLFVKNSTSPSSEKLIQKLEKGSPILVHDIDNTTSHLTSSIMMIKDSSTSLLQRAPGDLDVACRSSELINYPSDASLENFVCGHPAGKCTGLEEPSNNFDLNVPLTEEEAPTSLCLPTMKMTVTEVVLEVPILPESEADKQIDLSDDSKEPCEEIMRLAAEAIVAISMFVTEDTADDATPEPVLLERPDECLQWFVDVVSSYECHDQNYMSDIRLKGNDDFLELIPDGMDEFEYMTLNLEDVKVDECYPNYTTPVLENPEDEEAKATTLSGRPRRGQRGRQRKDFQRDVLPSLISLSKLEVTEDIQTFEEMLKSSGYSWQSSSSRRGVAKSSRGRRRSGAIPATRAREASCPPLVKKPVFRDVQVEDKTLIGWGKRTRRLPRQRCVNCPIPIP